MSQEETWSEAVAFSKDTADMVKRRMQYLRDREKELQPFTVTIHVTKKNDFLSTASRTGSDLVWSSDEPKDRGGQRIGPSPLSYFLSSMGFCQFVHYAEHAMDRNLKIDSLEMRMEGKASMQRPRKFTEVAYEVKIKSPESDEDIKNLARASAEDCYVTNTLRGACKVTGVIILNGRILDEH